MTEDFVGAGFESLYRWKLCTYVRPEFLRVSCEDVVTLDYGQIDFSPKHAVDCHRAMVKHGKGNVSARVKAMYPGVEIPALDLMLSHHWFTPIFANCRNVSVSFRRPVKLGSSNPNFVGSSGSDLLVCVSIAPFFSEVTLRIDTFNETCIRQRTSP